MNIESAHNDKKKETLSRFGIGSKGVVYILVGGLSAMAAFGVGGKTTGSKGALQAFSDNTLGQILLVLITVGLLAYVFWRMYQTFADPEDKGSDFKGVFRRVGYFSSGLFYGFLAYSAIKMIFNAGGSSSGGKESLIATLLNQDFGKYLVFAVALIFAGKAIWQAYRAYSGKFKDKIKETKLDEKVRGLLLKAGRFGYTSRGVVIAIIAFFTFKAGLTHSSEKAGGTKEAFQFLQNEGGTIWLGIIALGLIGYGLFMILKARYREMSL